MGDRRGEREGGERSSERSLHTTSKISALSSGGCRYKGGFLPEMDAE